MSLRITLRQSAADWCYLKPGADPAAHYRGLRAAGYTGVEMVAAENRRIARDAGLELVTHGAPGMTEGLNRRANHTKVLDGIREAIATARSERIANVIVFSGNQGGLDDQAGIEACAEALAQVTPEAQRAGVTLIFEALNTHDHADYHAHRSRFAFAVVERVASPALKVLYDIYHMHRMGDDVLADVTAKLPLIGHIHIAGAPRRDFPDAKQEIDYRRLVPAIHALGYRGYWGHEFMPAGNALDEASRSAALFSGYLAASVESKAKA